MVQAFNRDNESPPRLDNIAIDWNDSLRSSPWNTEVINLLVVDFQANIKTGSYASVIFDEDTMNLDDLRVLCIDKLRRTHQAHRDHSKIEGFANSQERENATCEFASRSSRRQRLDRLNTRRHGVIGPHYIHYRVIHVFSDPRKASENHRAKSPSQSSNLGYNQAHH